MFVILPVELDPSRRRGRKRPIALSTLDLPVERAPSSKKKAALLDARAPRWTGRRARRARLRARAARAQVRRGAPELRDEAAAASVDDLPAVLLGMSVRQRLIGKAEEALPDQLCPYLAHLPGRRGQRGEGLPARPRDVPGSVGRRAHPRLARRAGGADLTATARATSTRRPSARPRAVKARRIVAVERGALTRIVGDGLVLTRRGDGRWTLAERAALAMQPGGAGTAARPGSLGVGAGAGPARGAAEVTALARRRPVRRRVRAPEQPLLVLGSAGSGKTTVALHRLAEIAALDQRRCPLPAMNVVVPEEGLARLSRRLLSPLGAGKPR